jgi:hypothetical protein
MRARPERRRTRRARAKASIAALFVGVLSSGSVFPADSVAALYYFGSSVIDKNTGEQKPVLMGRDNVRPHDCPEGAYWTGKDQRDFIEDCISGQRYEFVARPADSSLPEGALPLRQFKPSPPKPPISDDPGPRNKP